MGNLIPQKKNPKKQIEICIRDIVWIFISYVHIHYNNKCNDFCPKLKFGRKTNRKKLATHQASNNNEFLRYGFLLFFFKNIIQQKETSCKCFDYDKFFQFFFSSLTIRELKHIKIDLTQVMFLKIHSQK